MVDRMVERSRFGAMLLIFALFALLPGLAHAADAAPFDVEKATRLWLDTLQGPARAKSDAYFEGGYWLILWGALASIVSDLLILRFAITAKIRAWAERISGGRLNATVWLVAVAYSVVGFVVLLPWTIWQQFLRERAYGLMNQTFAEWLLDQGKGLAVGLVILPLMAMAVYAVIRRFPRRWWLLGTGVFSAFLLFGVVVGPVFVSPLFNTYTELPAGPVRDRIVAMAAANHVPAEHIYVFDASKQTKRISANVSGLGPTIRISLNDNLLNRTTLPETAAVMGHELGHYVLHHVWRLVIVMSALAGLALWLAARIAPRLIARFGGRWGVRDLADPASMPVLAICFAVFGMLATPISNTLIRVNESEADAFGLNTAREPDGFALTAMKLSEYRKIEPGAVEEFLFFDHPSGATRVRMAMKWKKDHVPDAQMVTPPPLPQEGLKKEP